MIFERPCVVADRRRATFVASLTLVATLSTPSAWSQSSPAALDTATFEAARAHFERGVSLFQEQDYEGALAEFNRAYEQSHRASVLFNLSATYRALHRYPEALAALEQFLADPAAAHAHQLHEAERARAELQALVAHVRVAVDPSDASVRIDGRDITASHGNVIVGPGSHHLEARRAGFDLAQADVLIASGEVRDVALRLSPESASSAPLEPVPNQPSTEQVPSSPVASPIAAILVAGAPANAALEIDGASYLSQRPANVRPGLHRVVVSAPGMRPWRGEINVASGESRSVHVHLAAERQVLSPAYFWASAAGTVVLLGAAVTTGVLTLTTNADFQSRTQSDPSIDAIAQRGQSLALATDILSGVTVVAAALSVYLYTRTHATPDTSTAEVLAMPTSEGARAVCAVRF